MIKFFGPAQDDAGNSLKGFTVRILDNLGAQVAITADENGTNFETVNICPVDENGMVQFWYTPASGQEYQLLDLEGSVAFKIDDFSSAEAATQEGSENVDAVLGVDASDGNLGSFTGGTIPDDQPVKPAVQALETAVETKTTSADLAATTGATLVGTKAVGANSVDRTQAAKNADIASVKDFGATGDGTTDESSAISLANTSATANSEAVRFPDGVYAASGLTISNPVDMSSGSTLLHNGAQNTTLLTISGNSKEFSDITAKADGEDCTLVNLSGDNNTASSMSLRDGVASATSTTSIYGLLVSGDGNAVGHVSVHDFANTGQANESFPQSVLLQGDNNHIDSIFADGCASALNASSASGTNTVGDIVVRNASDNGIYHLGGNLSVGRLDYEGQNEPFIAKGGTGTRLYIGYCYNNGTGIAGVEDSGDVYIDHLHIGPNAASIFRTRAGQTASGRVHIRKVTGDYTGVSLWALKVGTIEYLTIGEMEVTFRYDAAVSGPISSWADFSGCKGFNFGTIRIRIIDVNDALTSSASRFTLRAPTTNLAYDSFVDRILVTIEKGSDGTDSPALMRGVGFFSNTLIQVENAYVERSGPFLREVAQDQHFSGIVFDSTSAPSAGTYRAGQIVYVNAPSAGDPIGHIYTGSAWEPFGIAGLEQAAAVADLNQTISGTYVQAEVQAISDKVDELLASERTAGQRAT